ncbi:MAG: O-antigen ligase family protein [Chloroherpetonaceae bacterium]|nr:O-antigen ligase family protein [Chloroherpetonaceae bacterium]
MVLKGELTHSSQIPTLEQKRSRSRLFFLISISIISGIGIAVAFESLPLFIFALISISFLFFAVRTAHHFGFFAIQFVFVASYFLFSNGLDSSPLYSLIGIAVQSGSIIILMILFFYYFTQYLFFPSSLSLSQYRIHFFSSSNWGTRFLWIWFVFVLFSMLFIHQSAGIPRRLFFVLSVGAILVTFFHYLPELLIVHKFYSKFIVLLLSLGAFFAGAGIFLMLLGIYQIPLFGGFLGLTSTGFASYPLMVSTFGSHPNLSALTYLVSIPVVLVIITSPEFKKLPISIRLILFFITGLMAFALIFSYSRGSLLAVVAASAFLLYYRSRKSFIWIFVVIIPIALYFASSFLTSKGTASTISRGVLYFISYKIITSSPTNLLFGTGLDVYTLFTAQREEFGLKDTAPSPHNVYVFFMIEFGLIGATLFYAFLIATIVRLVRWLKSNRSSQYFEVMILFGTILFGISIHQLFEDTIVLFNNFVCVSFFIACGVIHLISSRKFAEFDSQKELKL